MNSTRNFEQLQENGQGLGSLESALQWRIDGRLKNVHTALPGSILQFNPITQTAQVQPSIRRIFIDQGSVSLPICVDCPVIFPGGGDFFLTFPIKPGDECLLVFSERCIDNWFLQGGIQDPAEYRMHDLSDGFVLVGVNSQPRKLSDFNSDHAELRHRSGPAKITLHPDSLIITAPSGVQIIGDVTVAGDVIADGISLKNHIHGGVASGDSTTGDPQ